MNNLMNQSVIFKKCRFSLFLKDLFSRLVLRLLILHPIEMPFNNIANRSDPDQELLKLPDQGLLSLLMEI